MALATFLQRAELRAEPANLAVDACIEASERGQALRDEGRLIDARRAFLSCAEATCPGLIRKDCTTWHAEVDALVPSIVARAEDDEGRDLEATFTVDGVAVEMDGTPHELDPGSHTLSWTHDGRTIEESIVARAGEKSRLVDVTFEKIPSAVDSPLPPKPTPAPPKGEPLASGVEIPIASWVLGGVGVAGGVLFAVFASQAVDTHDELQDSCAPTCTDDDVDPVRRDLIVANISGGLGIAAITAAVVVAIVHNVTDETTARNLPVISVGAQGAGLAGQVCWQLDF